MARKTAMGKEPGTVSIAVPQSEKDRMKTGGKFQPGNADMAKRIVEGSKPGPLQRLSPGVYRNSAGELVGSKGQSLPGRKAQSLTERALNAANRTMGDNRRPPTQSSVQGLAQAPNMQAPPQQSQPMPQDQMNAAMQATNLGQQFPYPFQMQPGYPGAAQGQVPMVMQDLMYRYPPGTQMPNLQQAFQPQTLAQPNSISGLLQRNR